MAVRCNPGWLAAPELSYMGGSEMYSLEAMMAHGPVPSSGYADWPDPPDYDYQFQPDHALGCGATWDDQWGIDIINLPMPYLRCATWICGGRGLTRYPTLDRLQLSPELVAEAWVNASVGTPNKRTTRTEWRFFDADPGPPWSSFWGCGNGKWYCSKADIIEDTDNVSLSLGLQKIVPHGTNELRAIPISGHESAASLVGAGAVKFNVTEAIKAYCSNMNNCIGFSWYTMADTGFEWPTGDNPDWNSILKAIGAKYLKINMEFTQENSFYSFANGTQYLQDWGVGTIEDTHVTYSTVSVGTVWVRLTNGKVLALNDRVSYQLPPAFRV